MALDELKRLQAGAERPRLTSSTWSRSASATSGSVTAEKKRRPVSFSTWRVEVRYLAQSKFTDWSLGMMTAMTRVFFLGSASARGSTRITFQSLAGTVPYGTCRSRPCGRPCRCPRRRRGRRRWTGRSPRWPGVSSSPRAAPTPFGCWLATAGRCWSCRRRRGCPRGWPSGPWPASNRSWDGRMRTTSGPGHGRPANWGRCWTRLARTGAQSTAPLQRVAGPGRRLLAGQAAPKAPGAASFRHRVKQSRQIEEAPQRIGAQPLRTRRSRRAKPCSTLWNVLAGRGYPRIPLPPPGAGVESGAG